MNTRRLSYFIVTLALLFTHTRLAWAVAPSSAEISEARRWAEAKFAGAAETKSGGVQQACGADPFFSFTYDGKHSSELLKTWKLQRASQKLDEKRTRHELTYSDPRSELVLRCVGVEYADFPTVEWTLYFKNTGDKDTPILQDIQALDVQLERSDAQFRLHHNVGGGCSPEAYGALETILSPSTEKCLGGLEGNSTAKDMSYFNLEQAADKGMIIAVGWPGQWASRFACDKEGRLHIQAGQELTHFKLLPGEEVRTPLVVLQFWRGGDWLRAQNVWREWFIAHNLRKPGGKLPPAQLLGASGSTSMMVEAAEDNEKAFIKALLDCGLKPDLWWMDAGWYPCKGDWWHTGTWELDKKRFPNGLRPVTDYLHANGIRAILWFEPERVTSGTWLAENHPEWLLSAKKKFINNGMESKLFDFGNPKAWSWMVEHIDRMVTETNIDVYRQDFNIATLAFWRENDAEDRRGITEIRYVTGLLAYWDELLRRHPNVLYDNCAGGGRRNDLECMRRGVPYTKSDYWEDPVGVQGQTYGISLWLPYYASCWGTSEDSYTCRSKMAHAVGAGLFSALDKNNLTVEIHKRVDEWRKTVANLWGDYWPLTPYSIDGAAWMAWQFDRPESGEGVVQAFRHDKSPEDSAKLRLRGLDPSAVYTLADCDNPGTTEMTGRELMESGLPVVLKNRPAAAIITYKKKP